MNTQAPAPVAGRYRIVQPLGEGGLGAVYYAWDEKLQRPVALKRLHRCFDAGFKGDEGWREANVLASLQHPGIVTLYDFGEDENGPYFIMEYLAGQTLDKTVEQGRLEEEELFNIARQSLLALQAAHQKGIVHRDIKPPNLMLVPATNGTRIKILDFGLAKFQQEPQRQTMGADRSIMGSIHFIAPEQFSGGEVDGRSDLYALGNVLYFALSGRTAHDGKTITEIIASHLYKEPEPLKQVRPDLSGEFVQWVGRLMQRDPGARPRDAGQALLELTDKSRTRANIVLQTPLVIPFGPQNHSGLGKKLLPAGAGLLVLAAIVCVIGFWALKPLAKRRPEAFPVAATAVLQPDRGGETVFAPDDLTGLSQRTGATVMVAGVPVRVGAGRSGTVYYLNFSENYRESLALVFFPSDFKPVLGKDNLNAYLGKNIRVQGVMEIYREIPQIRIKSLDQIRILE